MNVYKFLDAVLNDEHGISEKAYQILLQSKDKHILDVARYAEGTDGRFYTHSDQLEKFLVACWQVDATTIAEFSEKETLEENMADALTALEEGPNEIEIQMGEHKFTIRKDEVSVMSWEEALSL